MMLLLENETQYSSFISLYYIDYVIVDISIFIRIQELILSITKYKNAIKLIFFL